MQRFADGVFQVVAPSGVLLPDLTVGAAYTGGHIKLTIADGSTDFIVGDTFTVAVSGDGKYYPCVQTAFDGTEQPVAILLEALAITVGTTATVLTRDAVIDDTYLVWGATYDSAPKKANALIALASAKNIIVATSV